MEGRFSRKNRIFLFFTADLCLESPDMDVADAREWLDRLGQAWRDRDPEAAADLFTVDASYRSHPFQVAIAGPGRDRRLLGIGHRAQSGIEVTFGEPAGRRGPDGGGVVVGHE